MKIQYFTNINKMKKHKLIIFILVLCNFTSLRSQSFNTDKYVKTLKLSTEIMINDNLTPTAASRFYAYICLATYQISSILYPKKMPSLQPILHKYNDIIIADSILKEIDSNLIIELTLLKISQKLLTSGFELENEINKLKNEYLKYNDHIKYVKTLNAVEIFIQYFKKYILTDRFNLINNYPKYTPQNMDGSWQPTSPKFISAIDPNWNKLRLFIIDSIEEIYVKPPIKYNKQPNSKFFRLMNEVYLSVKNKDSNKIKIANFWDCNPFKITQIGHIEFATKKISPGGHWIGITGIACNQKKTHLLETIKIHCLVSLAIADAFIICWNEKYKSNRIRPITAIQNLIDKNWQPILQTPPFPEYISGHSTISSTASNILTYYFGKNFSFIDNTEEEFDLPSRRFKNFIDASKEASISRLYGGIHFKDAINEGINVGNLISKIYIFKLKQIYNK